MRCLNFETSTFMGNSFKPLTHEHAFTSLPLKKNSSLKVGKWHSSFPLGMYVCIYNIFIYIT